MLLRLRPRRGRLTAAHDLASRGEDAAAEFLRQSGYEVLCRRVRLGGVEVDLVAKKEGKLVLVEVKARRAGDLTQALESVDSRKKSRLRRAARSLAKRMQVPLSDVEVDFVFVSFGPSGEQEIHHLPKFLSFD